jgi:hypothetical protein
VDNSTADIAIVREKTLFTIEAPPTVFFPAIALNIIVVAEDEDEEETTFAVAAAFAAERAAWTLILRNNIRRLCYFFVIGVLRSVFCEDLVGVIKRVRAFGSTPQKTWFFFFNATP